MNASAESLSPPNGHPHFLLPGDNCPVSHHSSSDHSIIAVYRDGISFIDQLGAMEGLLTIAGFWCGALPLWMVIDYDPGGASHGRWSHWYSYAH